MSIVEKERITKNEKTESLTLETPLGILKISPINIKFYRDNEAHEVEIHRYGCKITKHRKAYHDQFDLHDIPWKSVFIDLGEKDRISIGKSNGSWEIQKQ